jgi:hypothetical protein
MITYLKNIIQQFPEVINRKAMSPAAEHCCMPPSYVPHKGTYVSYDGTFGAPDQGQTLDV